MAKVFIEETTLTAIGDAIRCKEGSSELVPVNDMATRITDLPSGGGGGNEPTDEELTITGNCQYRFSNDGWKWFIEKYGNRITTKDITTCGYMFSDCTLQEQIPFQINIKDATYLPYMFKDNKKLSTCPKIRGTIAWSTSTFVQNLINGECLRNIDDLFTSEMLEGISTVKVSSAYSSFNVCSTVYNLLSLRKIPDWWYSLKLNPESTAYPAASYSLYYYTLYGCYNLDEARNIPVWVCKGAQTGNMFSNFLSSSGRLKAFTFETNEDGSPIVTQWKGQVIDLSKYIGYASVTSNILNYNSGITKDKEVWSDESYERLKDDPDWFTTGVSYSRYNRYSAIETINSLPDTSAYLATAGGTNTIKFKGQSGELTDRVNGGAIRDLTEEEIAVATAKGWTVTLA